MSDVFCHTILSKAKHINGWRLGIDTWDNTACEGKHAFVEAFIMGKFITAKAFTTSIGYLHNLLIVNVLYVCDAENGEMTILEAKNSIYLCDKMDDSFPNSIQDEEVGVLVETCTKRFF